MNHKILFPFLLLCFSSVFSQTSTDKIIYLDSLSNYSNKANYEFMWVIKDFYGDQDFNEATEYYKSGKVKMIGVYSNKMNNTVFSYIDNIPLRGIVKEFYENGNRKRITNLTNIESTKMFEWYENGEKKSEREFSLTKEEFRNYNEYGTRPKYYKRFLQFWDENGIQKVIDGNGEYEYDDKFEYEKGNYVRGQKEGIWIGKDKKNNFTYTETYKDGKLIKGISLDSNNIKHQYKSFSMRPELKKHKNKFSEEISVFNTKFSETDNIFNLVEKVVVLNINTDGVTTVGFINGFDDPVEKMNLIKVLNKYNEFTPSIKRGVAIPDSFTYRFITKNESKM